MLSLVKLGGSLREGCGWNYPLRRGLRVILWVFVRKSLICVKPCGVKGRRLRGMFSGIRVAFYDF